MPVATNLPATRLLATYLLRDPPSLLPHLTVRNLLTLPVPLGPTLSKQHKVPVKIRALVLDKDNTLCPPNSTSLHPAYIAKLNKIKQSPEFASNAHSILIVSNTAGSSPASIHEDEALLLEKELHLPVLRQQVGKKKPLCAAEVLAFFKEHDVTTNPAEICVVGDRLATDVLLAREMGAWSVWVQDGWRNPETQGRDYRGFMSRMENRMEKILRGGFGYKAPVPLQKGVDKN